MYVYKEAMSRTTSDSWYMLEARQERRFARILVAGVLPSPTRAPQAPDTLARGAQWGSVG